MYMVKRLMVISGFGQASKFTGKLSNQGIHLETKGICRLPPFVYLSSLVLWARHHNGSAFCNVYRLEVPEQVLGGISLGLI